MAHGIDRKPLLTERERPYITRFEVTENFDEASVSATGVLLKLKAKLGEADIINRNGRLYPQAVMTREVERMRTRVAANAGLGQADHPGAFEGATVRNQAILLSDIYMEGREVWGSGKVLATAAGRDVAVLMRAGAAVGMSSRARGSVGEAVMDPNDTAWAFNQAHAGKRYDRVADDLELEAYDVVIDPGFADATVRAVRESFTLAPTDPYHAEDTMELKEAQAKIADLEKKLAEQNDAVTKKAKEITDAFSAELSAAREELKKATAALAEAKATPPAPPAAPAAPAAPAVDPEIARRLAASEVAIAELRKENSGLNAQVTEMRAAETGRQERQKINAYILEKVAGKPGAEALAKDLAERCGTTADVDRELERVLKLAEAIKGGAATEGLKPGDGIAKGVVAETIAGYGASPEASQKVATLDEARARMVGLAGGQRRTKAPVPPAAPATK